MEEEDDDIFGVASPSSKEAQSTTLSSRPKPENSSEDEEDLEEGEEEEEEDSDDSDSDIDIITERQDAPPTELRPPASSGVQKQSVSVTKPSPDKPSAPLESKGTSRPGSEFPAIATSKIELEAQPVYEPTGKPLTQLDLDTDFKDDDKPWRRPGTDVTDFFNYGFDEFTWASYCLRQEKMRGEIQDEKTKMQEFGMMMDMSGMPMPGMPGVQSGPATGSQSNINNSQVPGMADMPPGMQEMMNQYLRAGGNPLQMDPAAMFAAMQSSGTTPGGPSASVGPNQAQSFGPGNQSYGQNQQQMGFGYDQPNVPNTEGQSRQGNFRGRGRGGRRW